MNCLHRRVAAGACETCRKHAPLRLLFVCAVVAILALPAAAGAQGHAAGPADPESAQAAVEEAEHGEASPWVQVGKLVNFGLLVGILVYLLRAPIRNYLAGRGTEVRHDLERAAEMKEHATRQIAEIEAKLAQLPAELDDLRARGREEVAAEETRINEAADAERTRLLEQTRREIDLQLRIAHRDLVTHAADLAVQVARERIRREITDADQQRLVDRYLEQVRTHE